MNHRYVFFLVGAVLAGAVIWFAWPPKKTAAPTVTVNTNTATNVSADVDTPVDSSSNTIVFSTTDLPDRDPAFDFTAYIPKSWRVEYVADSQAINIYDPQAKASSNLEKSQIFVKYFSASSFQTLSTVDIISQASLTINNRPAIAYTIKKKSSAKNFASQPSWRNIEHRVTDIRSTDNSPTTFYVFAKAPTVGDSQFDAFLNSVRFAEI